MKPRNCILGIIKTNFLYMIIKYDEIVYLLKNRANIDTYYS